MKAYRSLACILMISLPFMSCFSDNAKMKTIEKMPNPTETSITVNKLDGQTFKSRQGHSVGFYQIEEGQLKATVKVATLGDYFSNPHVGLPVCIERNLDQQKIDANKLRKWEEKEPIHVKLAKEQKPIHIHIAQEGLMGGGRQKKSANKKKKNNPKKKGKDLKDTTKPSNNLSLPNPAALSNGKRLPDKEVKDLLAKAQKCKEDPAYRQVAIDSFLALAKRGSDDVKHEAMYQLGLICEEQRELELAVRWYVAAFEHSWWKDPQQAHHSLACVNLKRLGCERIPLIYPDNITKENISRLYLQYEFYEILIEFYKNGTAEPYLTQEENEKKIDKLTKTRDLILQRDKDTQAVDQLLSKKNSTIKCLINADNYKEAEAHLRSILEKLPSRYCLYHLGIIYGRQGKYQEAAELYRKARTPSSFSNLGTLYFRGLIGKTNGKIDYQTVVKYFEISGCPEALFNLSRIYVEGYTGPPDYQKAAKYLNRLDSGDAYSDLGLLYLRGYIGNNTPHPDYILAEQYFRKATAKGCIQAWHNLGLLYYAGHVHKDNDQPNYKLAVECFEKATKPSTNYFLLCEEGPRYWQDALWSLGITYVQGYYGKKNGKPDYEKAKMYFEQAGTAPALYNIGLLYEKGYIGISDSKDNYLKALEYYKKSETLEAKLAILHFYRLGHITTDSPEEKKEIINKTIEDIGHLLPSLPMHEQLYTKGMVEYYMGDWGASLLAFKESWILGGQQTELPGLIEGLGSYDASKVEGAVKVQESPIEVGKEELIIKEKKIELLETTQEAKIIESKPSEVGIKPQELPIEKEEECSGPVELKQVTSWCPLSKAQKKLIQTQRNKNKFLDNFEAYSTALQQPGGPVELEFINDRARKTFEAFSKEKQKLDDILGELQNDPRSIQGPGNHEFLKGNLNGCRSREINKKDRLVYRVVGSNTIRILSWEGHYKKVIDF